MMEHSEHRKPGDLCLMEQKDISHCFLGADTTEKHASTHHPDTRDLPSPLAAATASTQCGRRNAEGIDSGDKDNP